jgi:carbon-monoxide dehydrogenase medium subunit
MKAPAFTYHRAETVGQSLEKLRQFADNGKVIAGGQTLMPILNLRMAAPDHLIDISRLAELREVRADGTHWRVGAGVTHAMIEDGRIEDFTNGYLQYVAAGIAYRAIRNRGTVGGSLIHSDPAADWPCALLAIDAIVVILGPRGERAVPLAEFQTGLMSCAIEPDELLVAVRIPRLSGDARWAYQKFCRKVGEFAHSIGAVVHDPVSRRSNVVLGAVGDKPVRLPRLSTALAGGLGLNDLDGESLAEAARDDLVQTAQVKPGSYAYQLHHTMVMRALKKALQT